MRVIIDIGHADGTGARGNGKEEHALCAVIGAYLGEELRKGGVEVVTLDYPELGNKEDLVRTAQEANKMEADCGVSLHMDSAGAEARGAHVCYVSSGGKKLAEEIAKRLCELLPGRAERVVKRSDLYILKHTRAVWCLCECGFITHEGDCKLAVEKPLEIARAIAGGIISYLRSYGI